MARLDYMCDEDGDLVFEDGDLVVVESDEQHVQDIIQLTKGGLREFPVLGVDAIKYVRSTGKRPQFERVVKEELKADGYAARLRFQGEALDDFTVII